MASIVKRKKSYALVYNYVDENGNTRQKWETWHTYKDALKRKAEVENKLNQGIFIAPNKCKIKEFMNDFVALYGEKKWGASTYKSSCSLIKNYINPIIGDLLLQEFTPIALDRYIRTLRNTPPVIGRAGKPKSEYLPPATIEKILKLLHCAFGQAVGWSLIAESPFARTEIEKVKYSKRDIWNADLIRQALDSCTDSKLYIAMNISFACSLRLGEILGLQWSNVHISADDIATDNAYIYVDKELARVSQKAVKALGNKDIYHVFPSFKANPSTILVLKTPKTDTSVRKVWLPKTVAYILLEWKKNQDEIKAFLGNEYKDYDLVVALSDGRPCQQKTMEIAFDKLKKEVGLPNVVFHSLRHSSTTYKLKLNHGDLKATQGDTGHADTTMITEIYAHILDGDRKINAQKFESAFYCNPDLRNIKAPQEPLSCQSSPDIEGVISALTKSPELVDVLSKLVAIQSNAV